MSEPAPSEDKIQVAIHQAMALIKVTGRGSFKISSSLKNFVLAAQARGCSVFIVDMATCIGMDSTFMGVLAGMALKIRQIPGGEIVLINMTVRTRQLLATLGLDQVVTAYSVGKTPDRYAPIALNMAELSQTPEQKQAIAETMLEAHENLVKISADNLPRFKDVLAYLREDIQKPGPQGDG